MALPDGFATTLGLSFERTRRVRVPTEVDAGSRTLSVTLFQLGFGDAPSAGVARPAASSSLADEGEFINSEEFNCQLIRESLDLAILRAQSFVGPFPPDLASPLIQEYKAALLLCGGDSLGGQQAALEALSCAKVEGATLNAEVFLVESGADLNRSLGYLIAAEGMAQVSGADCNVRTEVMETEFDEFLQSYIARIQDPGFVADFASWDALWRELRTCLEVTAMSQAFGVPQAEETISRDLFPALFARLREVARDACAEDENNSFYLDILTGGHALNHPISPEIGLPVFTGFDADSLLDEMHRCGASVFVETKADDDELLDSATIVPQGSGGVRAVDSGRLVLHPDVPAFTCGGIVHRPPARVRAEIPGHLPVVDLGILAQPRTIAIGPVLAALPQDDDLPPRAFDMVVERDRSVCGITAEGTLELFRFTVNTSGFEGQLTGAWEGECESGSVAGSFAIVVSRDGSVTGGYSGDATGTISGTVSPNGSFDASANGTAGSCHWSGSMRMAGGSLSASGTWGCEGSCSGTFTGP